MSLNAIERRLKDLGYDHVVARLHTVLGLEQRYLYPYALPAGQQYVPAHYEQAARELEAFPSSADALAMRGRALRMINRRAESLDAFAKALKLSPSHARALAWRGEFLVNLEGEAERGLADLRAAVKAAPKDPWPWIWEAAARLAASAGPETFAALAGALKADPRSVCALLLRSTAHDRVNKPEAALTDAARAAQLDPACAGAFIMRGRFEAKLGREAAAAASFAAAARKEPDAKNHYEALISPNGLKGGPEGLRQLDDYIRKHPKAAWAWALRGDYQRSAGSQEMDAGMDDLIKAVKLDPKTPWIRACLARSRVQYKYAEAGIKDLQTAVKLDPKSAWLHSWLAESYRRVGRYKESVASWRRASSLDPRFAQFHMWLGRAHCDRKLWEQGAAEFTKAIELDCAYGFAFAKRGEALARLGRHAEALADFDRALNLQFPFPPEWILGLRSRSRLAAGDYRGAFEDLALTVRESLSKSWVPLDYDGEPADKGAGNEALTALNEALAQNHRAPGSLVAWRGAVRAGLGRLHEALMDLNRAVEMEPSFAWGRAFRARALWHAGRGTDAAAEFDAALVLDERCPWLWSWRAELRLGLGKAELALQDAERALRLSPRLGHGLFCKGEALRQLGRKAEARKSLDQAIDADYKLAVAYISRGVLLGETGDHEGQFRDFDHAAHVAPDLFRRKIESAKASGAGAETVGLLQSLLDSALADLKTASTAKAPATPNGR